MYKPYLSFLERSTLKAGLYILPKGGVDKQQPHTLDEVYFVVEGHSKFKVGEEEMTVIPGTVLYVKAGVDHRFFDITGDLKILVFFSGARS